MPVVYQNPDRNGGKSYHFTLAGSIGFDGDKVCERILKERKIWLIHRDTMLEFQKEFSKLGDFETAKFFKKEADHGLKFYRCCCYLIPYVCANPPKDCPIRDLYEIGPEMFTFLEYLENLCTLENL